MIHIAVCDDEKYMSNHIRSMAFGFFRKKNREVSLRMYSSGGELLEYDGQLVAHEILSEKKFDKILVSKGLWIGITETNKFMPRAIKTHCRGFCIICCLMQSDMAVMESICAYLLALNICGHHLRLILTSAVYSFICS